MGEERRGRGGIWGRVSPAWVTKAANWFTYDEDFWIDIVSSFKLVSWPGSVSSSC